MGLQVVPPLAAQDGQDGVQPPILKDEALVKIEAGVNIEAPCKEEDLKDECNKQEDLKLECKGETEQDDAKKEEQELEGPQKKDEEEQDEKQMEAEQAEAL